MYSNNVSLLRYVKQYLPKSHTMVGEKVIFL